MAVPDTGVVVRVPSTRWTVGWRIVAVLLGIATTALLVRYVAVAPPTILGIGWAVLRAGFAVWCAWIAWRWAPQPRLTRADARNLLFDPIADADMSVRLRHRFARDEPLTPDLRRHAVVLVARWSRYQPWLAAGGGVWASLGLLVGSYRDIDAGVVTAMVAVAILASLARDARTVRTAVAMGAVPGVEPDPASDDQGGNDLPRI